METTEELQEFLTEAIQDGVWGKLLDRGTAWAIMRQDGELPQDAPLFGETIDTDLAEYGFSVLRAALALKEAAGSTELSQRAFEKAAIAFESLVKNGSPETVERGFYRVIAGAAYHLAGYSAIAYSLFSQQEDGLNTSPAENALILLILRDLTALREGTKDWLLDEENNDQAIATLLENEEIEKDDAIAIILNSTICRALSYFDFALQTGEASLLNDAKNLLNIGMKLAGEAGFASIWWVSRLCLNMISDLWEHSLHANLPTSPPEGGEEKYKAARQLFLASLYGRKNAEVELWPSQREAAKRSSDTSDDLVVALPTSAGKTRVAEIAALMTLSCKKRVLIVTPLRALSAQTERSFRKTFSPLGFTVSSLYGASGISASDENSLRSKDIVISTPEKLDFALRNDPTLINDIGLIVLDEGHMIGPNEREIKYEILVQRLLRRPDSTVRRIVCLSAVLPDGEQLDDLTAWIRSDVAGKPIKSLWRPTRQRFGALTWQGTSAKVSFDLEEDGPFLAKFIEQIPPLGQQQKYLPRNVQDLSLLAAWNFSAQGKRTLIFITQANWVEGFGSTAIDLVRRGYLPSLLDHPAAVERAIQIGQEWLGDGHPAVESLKIGIAIHHGGLPNPFLREIEGLLSAGIIKVTVASPTLTQGININAAVLLVPYLVRAGELIKGEEFANVAGRAGRAFVDVEGLVLHVIFDKKNKRLKEWKALVASSKSRALSSGLIQIVSQILSRLANNGVLTRADAFEYLANSQEAWATGNNDGEDQEPLSHLVEKLDSTVFGLIEALEAESADLPRLLDEALQGSLWARQISREPENVQIMHKAIFNARAHLIWSKTTPTLRKGHYAMGVGLETGLALDDIAEELATYIDLADNATLTGDEDELAGALIHLARRLLVIRPFVPASNNALPADWENILRAWVTGVEVNTIKAENMPMVEDAFTYRLVWALEALRVRRVTLGWSPDIITGGGAASLETGVPQYMMAMLIRAGLPSRQAAMIAIREGNALFVDGAGMRRWLESDEIQTLTNTGEWPTSKTASLWKRFKDNALDERTGQWHIQNSKRVLALGSTGERPPNGIYRVEVDKTSGVVWVCSPDYKRLVRLKTKIADQKNPGFFTARFIEDDNRAQIQRLGRGQAIWLDK